MASRANQTSLPTLAVLAAPRPTALPCLASSLPVRATPERRACVLDCGSAGGLAGRALCNSLARRPCAQ